MRIGIYVSAAATSWIGAGLLLLLILSGCKSNADKSNDIVLDKTGYSKVIHKPVGNPPYTLSRNGCPEGWAITSRFLERDGSRQPSCLGGSGDTPGIEIDYILPGEKVTGIDWDLVRNQPRQ